MDRRRDGKPSFGEPASAGGLARRLPQARVAVADASEREAQGVDVARKTLRFVDVDHLPHEQLSEMLIEALAAGFLVADAAFELVELGFEDVLPHERRGHHDFDDGDSALAFAPLSEALADDGLEI